MKTVLVIDDEAHILSLVRNCLEPHYRVLTAIDGEKGLEMAIQEKPDLVLCDILMPLMDGYEFAERMRFSAELRSVPLVLLTAVSQTDSLLRAGEMGVTDYLIKPINVRELPGLVEDYIRTGPRPF